MFKMYGGKRMKQDIILITVLTLSLYIGLLPTIDASSYDLRPLTKVSSGRLARDGQFPYVVAIGTNSFGTPYVYTCGGCLLTPNWVLTSAYCIGKNTNYDLVVVAGAVALGSTGSSSRQVSRVVQRITHPQYQPGSSLYDIGLLRTYDYFNSTFWVTFAPLPGDSFMYSPGTNLVIAGWGFSQTQVGSSLQYYLMPKTTNTMCASYGSSFGSPGRIPPDSMICAGFSKQEESVVCRTDAGSPLVVEHGRTLIGVASYANVCGVRNQLSLFTNVASYVYWIKQYLKNTPSYPGVANPIFVNYPSGVMILHEASADNINEIPKPECQPGVTGQTANNEIIADPSNNFNPGIGNDPCKPTVNLNQQHSDNSYYRYNKSVPQVSPSKGVLFSTTLFGILYFVWRFL